MRDVESKSAYKVLVISQDGIKCCSGLDCFDNQKSLYPAVM